MMYKVINKSRQEGVVSVNGQWRTVAAGESFLVDGKPGDCTANVKVVPVAAAPRGVVNVSRPAVVPPKTLASSSLDDSARVRKSKHSQEEAAQ